MATMPPPYSPRDARRQARAMRQAQKARYHAQAAFLRRPPSFVGPLLLITVGVIALLLEMGRLPAGAFWPWYARWWPLLLVIIGVGLLIEYFVDRKTPGAGGRSIGGVIWLIILLSVVGGLGNSALNLGPWRDHLDNFGDRQGWLSMLGEEHVEDHTLSEPIGADGSLLIDNARGAVDVSAAEAAGPGEIRVVAHQVVHASSDQAARRDLDAVRPTLTRHGNDATLTTAGRDGANVDLKVTVPPGVLVTVRTAHGDVALSGLRRNLDVTLAHGDVTVDNAGAAVHLKMDHGDVTAHDIAGDFTMDGRADDVTLSGVKGRCFLQGDFFGDTRISGAGSQLHFHSSRTDLEVPKLGGEMTLDSSNLRLVAPSGGLRLTTRDKDVEVTDLVGDAHIENHDGDVNVSAALPMGDLDLKDRTGSIVVTVPSNANFSVHGTTSEHDELNSDFSLRTETSGGGKTLSGQVGSGGSHLELATRHGDLSLRRGGVHVPQLVVPEVNVPGVHVPRIVVPQIDLPAPPDPPVPPGRHLHSKGEAPETSVQ